MSVYITESNHKKNLEPLAGLEKGLEILEPFLKLYDFGFKGFENFRGEGRHLTLAKFKNKRREFILGYRFSVGQIVYQFDKLSVSHDFYLDKLGFGSKKKFEGVQTEDKLLPFKYILSDFDYLVDDFFEGECIRLQAYSKLQDNIIKEYDQKARKRYNSQFYELRILEARSEFINKNYKKSIEIYTSIDIKCLLNDLDGKIIEFCKIHL